MKSIAAVYSEARGSPLFPTIARASAAGLLNLPAKPQFASVAQEAMRGFLLLGDKQQTRAWTKLALNAAYNNARAMNALDRLMPLVAVAGIDDPKRLPPPEEVNRWYEVIRQDDPARAPLRGYLLLELFRATGIDVPPRSTDLPEAPPAGVRLASPPAATLQALQAAGRRPSPRRDGGAGVDRHRRDAARRASSRRGRRHRAGAAPGRRGPCRAPVRDRDGDRLRPVKKKPAPPLPREGEAFIEMLTAERGASKNTEAAYSADLKNLEAFLARRKQKPVTANADALRAYLKSLDYVGMTPRTVARRLSVIRQFFRFLLAERLREDDPASTLDSPKLGRPLPKVLSRVEVDRLIEAAQAKGGDDGGRMETLLEILYGTGLRVSELVTLPLAAVERDPTMLMVRGKGDKDRLVPLSDPARAAIAKWLHVRAARSPRTRPRAISFRRVAAPGI